MGKAVKKVKAVITGFSGVGKTVVGKELSKLTGFSWADLDAEVERLESVSVSELIRVEGIQAFRAKEVQALDGLLAEGVELISLGGGALTYAPTAKLLSDCELLINLEASTSVIVQRVLGDEGRATQQKGAVRPLLAGASPMEIGEKVSKLKAERESVYQNIKNQIVTDFLNPTGVAKLLKNEIILFEEMTKIQKQRKRVVIPIKKGGLDETASVIIGHGVIDELVKRILSLTPKTTKVAAIIDQSVAKHWRAKIEENFKGEELELFVIEVPAGEKQKTLATVEQLAEKLVEFGLTRSDTVLAIGGGVVGDLAGFLASIYLRGVNLIQVPTSLVAQVDSAIGGKTGVNLQSGKNLIGTFNEASLIISDTELLSTLPDGEFNAGMAEVIKYGLISSAEFFVWLEQNASAIRKREKDALLKLVEYCTRAKLEVVAADLNDRLGKRAMLNFGHTVGHAIELLSGYGSLRHGEAVAIGMVTALEVGEKRGKTVEGAKERTISLLEEFELPVKIPEAIALRKNSGEKTSEGEAEVLEVKWLKALMADKKRDGDEIDYVIVEQIGCSTIEKISAKEICKYLVDI